MMITSLFRSLFFVAAVSGAPPTRIVPLLSKQPAFCGKQFGTNYVWLAQAHLECLGMSHGCEAAGCGVLEINGQSLKVNHIGDDDHDVCGSCEGCPTAFIGLDSAIPNSAQAFEGKNATLVYHPPSKISSKALPTCRPLPGPWKTLQGKKINPGCSPSENQGSLDATTEAECLAKAKARGDVNYAIWSGKSCDVCAFRWRGPAEGWKYSDLSGATSFVWYLSLPPPKPSAPCPPCPASPSSPETTATLSNGNMEAAFGPRGLARLSSRNLNLSVSIDKDAFALGLDGHKCFCSSSLAVPVIHRSGSSAISFTFTSPAQELSINVTYKLRHDAAFVSKAITLVDSSGTNRTREVNSVTAMDGANPRLQLPGKAQPVAPTESHISNNVQFTNWADPRDPSTHSLGSYLTAQNSFVQPPSLTWMPDQNWTTLDSAGQPSPRILDAAIFGLYGGSTSQLEFVEAAAVSEAVSSFLVAPSEPNVTVKINIAWCENDYQLDISREEDRETYKRIIDRAAAMGLTHILFAPRNSDVSSRGNNSDPWGWEQLLWFGYGQQLRMGLWKPGDPLAASLVEMLDYFKFKGVKPVAYVYPILAFLAGTLPGGGSPPWIVQGTYQSQSQPQSQRGSLVQNQQEQAGGVLRSNLANEEFIQWLPETMLRFAEQTGAGGFSFDLTYWEEGLPVASQYAQWAGWRSILSQLHTKGGGRGCAGGRCVVDNRQANHAWGAWMWALGGTYAEPLMSDEQPGSWSFYEADLHTDRLAGNKQRAVAKGYRDAFCPNEALPGFAFHQTDRDPTDLQKQACSDGRCTNHSRVRDFDLLGYRYSLLSSIGTGGLNNVLNMLPARDVQEFQLFPKEDLAFIRSWIDWADQNIALLKLTRPVPSLSTPGAGLADGTIMLRGDDTGVMFLFNPTHRYISTELPLSGHGSASLGFKCDDSSDGGSTAGAQVLVRQLGSSERTHSAAAAFNLEILDCVTGILRLELPPTSARVLAFEQWSGTATPLLLGSPYSKATVDAGTLTISGAYGESGTAAKLVVVLPERTPKVTRVEANGQQISSFSSGQLCGLPAVTVDGSWDGTRFQRSQEILQVLGGDGQNWLWTGTFSVPQAVLDQLQARNASYPILYNTDPHDSDDANLPWLAPGRLLIFVKYPTPIDDMLNITGNIDGQELMIRKAYNTIVRNAGRFIGHWADVTPVIKPGKKQTLTLLLPGQPTVQGVFFDNVETIFTEVLNK